MKYLYISHLNKYLSITAALSGHFLLFTNEELDYSIDQEHARERYDRFSAIQWLNIFLQDDEGENKKFLTSVKKIYREKVKLQNNKVKVLSKEKDNFLAETNKRPSYTERQTLRELFTDMWKRLIRDAVRELNRCQKVLDYIRYKETGEQTQRGITPETIEIAKQQSILNYLSFPPKNSPQKRAMILCEFHEDKNPSMVIYVDQNSFYCYSCNVGGDVIEFIQNQKSLSFIEAVKFLVPHGKN